MYSIPFDWRDKVDTCKVSMIQQKSDTTWKVRLTYPNGTVNDYAASEIGKIIFYTLEEAEAAMKEI